MPSCLILKESIGACQTAAAMLSEGAVVAIPGLTNYALVVDATCASAVDRVYALKGRSRRKPLTLLSPPHDVERFIVVPEKARGALCLMGDPLALVGRARSELPFLPNLHAGGSTLGVFWLSLPVHRYLYVASRCPIAGTSLNESEQPMIRRAAEAIDRFGDRVDVVIDGGDAPMQHGQSTVLDLSVDPPKIIRFGLVTPSVVRRFVQALNGVDHDEIGLDARPESAR